MFQYAVKGAVKPATEGTANVIMNYTPTSISAGFVHWVNGRIVDSLIASLARHLAATGMAPADINAKMFELVGEMGKRQDVSDVYAKYVTEWNPSEEADYKSKSKLNELKSKTSTTWSDFYDIVESTMRVLKWSGDDNRDKLNDREKELFKEYDEAAERYWKARDKVYDYCYDIAIDQMDGIIKKYGDTIGKISQDWLDKVSSYLKEEVDALNRRREAKKAEDDSALNRPVVA